MMPTTRKKLIWRGSKARDLLEKDLVSGDLSLDVNVMDAREVYLQRPEFADFEYDHFRTAYGIYEIRSKKKITALLLLVLRMLVIEKYILRQVTINEANHKGKGRKRNGFFDLTWMMAKTRA
jgi:hypothetical protein